MAKRTRGIVVLVAPFVSLVLILILWTVISFVATSLALKPSGQPQLFNDAVHVGQASAIVLAKESPALTTIRLVNDVLGFLGMLSILAIPVCLVLGILILTKHEPEPTPPTTKL